MKINSAFFKNESEFNKELEQSGTRKFITTELANGEILATVCSDASTLNFRDFDEVEAAVQNALVQIHAAVLSGYITSGGLVKEDE